MWRTKSCLLLLLVLLLATYFANAAVGDACTARPCNYTNNEVCNYWPAFICLCGNGYSNNAGSCNPVDCETAPTLTNGRRTDGGGTVYTDKATYGCNTGYTLTNTATIHCRSNGQWNALRATCTIVDCGTAPTLTNGSRTDGGGTVYTDQATYACNTGYTLANTATKQCKSNAQWDVLAPTCTIVVPPIVSLDCPMYKPNNSVTFCTNNYIYGTDVTIGTWTLPDDSVWDCQCQIDAHNPWSGSYVYRYGNPETCGVILSISTGYRNSDCSNHTLNETQYSTTVQLHTYTNGPNGSRACFNINAHSAVAVYCHATEIIHVSTPDPNHVTMPGNTIHSTGNEDSIVAMVAGVGGAVVVILIVVNVVVICYYRKLLAMVKERSDRPYREGRIPEPSVRQVNIHSTNNQADDNQGGSSQVSMTILNHTNQNMFSNVRRDSLRNNQSPPHPIITNTGQIGGQGMNPLHGYVNTGLAETELTTPPSQYEYIDDYVMGEVTVSEDRYIHVE